MKNLLKCLIVVLPAVVVSAAFAGEPIHACRAQKSTLTATMDLSNNSGCLITRASEAGVLEVLMIRTHKDGGGYGFPGGGTVSIKKDQDEAEEGRERGEATKADRFLALNKALVGDAIDYKEPVACTAARETKEETGIDVIVGDLLVQQKYFLAFLCYAHPGSIKNMKALDTHEIKDENPYVWISQSDFLNMKDAKKGETTERFIYDNNGILEAVFSRGEATVPGM